ncbi:Ell1-associated factor 1 [Neolecta irregularis DAH-3]|uniref:Ell1-associated factor 1 n=1 Tax=Neolecta irregularis (strain DAH-3) TaxID=1198029 RepID=A0A1U7LMX3_NEOID|nr:Ell1-associated factor 1 [Neolecta irregularis DAH-3]|eukprot:OLL24020.1 Ell1-associated factor 1 [Neolecta irregularis DAH-3]
MTVKESYTSQECRTFLVNAAPVFSVRGSRAGLPIARCPTTAFLSTAFRVSMIVPGMPARYTVELGKSFDTAGGDCQKLLSVRCIHSIFLKFEPDLALDNFKPESIDTRRPGKLSGGPKSFDVEWNSTQVLCQADLTLTFKSERPHLFTSGIPSHGRDVDCCLVFDPKTGVCHPHLAESLFLQKFTLEIVDMFMRFNQDRSKTRQTSNTLQFPIRTTPTLSDTESGKRSPFLQGTKRSPTKSTKLLASPPQNNSSSNFKSISQKSSAQRVQKPAAVQHTPKTTPIVRKPTGKKTVLSSKKLPTPPPTCSDSPKGLGLEMPSGLIPMDIDAIPERNTEEPQAVRAPLIRKPKIKRSSSPESEESSSESDDSEESDANESEDDLDDLANMLEEDLVQENSSGSTPTFPLVTVNGLPPSMAPRSMSDLARF